MSPTCSTRTKTGSSSCRPTCSQKTAASGSTASAKTASPPSPKTASRTCARSSPMNEPPTARRRAVQRPNSPACGAHRMLTALQLGGTIQIQSGTASLGSNFIPLVDSTSFNFSNGENYLAFTKTTDPTETMIIASQIWKGVLVPTFSFRKTLILVRPLNSKVLVEKLLISLGSVLLLAEL